MLDLTKENEGKVIIKFATPMLVGGLFQQLYNTVDSIIVGRFIGKDAMAAVSGANPIMFLLTSLLMGISLGFSILISQYYGSKDMDKVKLSVNTTYVFVFVSSLFITIIGIAISGPILNLMNTPLNIYNSSRSYLVIIFAGTIFSSGYNAISSILRGLGDSKTPLYFLILATFVNIVLDIIFVIYFNMGIEGVALATIIAQAISFLSSIFYLNSKHSILRVNFKNICYDKEIFNKGIKLGIPTGIQQMLFSIGNIALQSLVNSFGTDAMAAFGAGCRIETFISIPIMNLGAAVSSFVAQNIGANKYDRVENGVKASLKISLLLSIVVAIIFVLFSNNLISIFNTDKNVVYIGSKYLRIIGPFFIFVCYSFVLSSSIRGAGDTLFAMISSIVSLWLARIPASFLLSKLLSVDGIWLGIPIGWIVGFMITIVYYKKGLWKKKSIIENNKLH